MSSHTSFNEDKKKIKNFILEAPFETSKNQKEKLSSIKHEINQKASSQKLDYRLAQKMKSHTKTMHLSLETSKLCFKSNNSIGISCTIWNNEYYISGLDITKIIQATIFLQKGQFILNNKKFEEGIFSDLRSLKHHYRLEDAKSDFLQYLLKHNCIKTLKKQKVYLWKHLNFEKFFNDSLIRIKKTFNHIPLRSMSSLHQAHQAPIAPRPNINFEQTNISGKNFHCHFCEKEFKRQDHLKRHEIIHTGEKPFICTKSFCLKTFTRKDNLTKHIRTHDFIHEFCNTMEEDIEEDKKEDKEKDKEKDIEKDKYIEFIEYIQFIEEVSFLYDPYISWIN